MAYQRGAMARRVIEEDTDIPNANIKMPLRPSGNYVF